MNIILRSATIDDAEELTDLCMVSKKSHGYDENFMERCKDELTVTPRQIQDNYFWVAECDIICGCTCLKVDADKTTGEIEAFFVHPEFQKLGVGRILWNKIIQTAHKDRLSMLHLASDPFAEGFYKKLGFTTTRYVPSGSIAGRTIPYMEMSL